MAHEEALLIVNEIQNNMAFLARAIVNAVKDGKVSPGEGLSIGMKGMGFATTLLALVESNTPELRNDILFVLEHCSVVMEDKTSGSS